MIWSRRKSANDGFGTASIMRGVAASALVLFSLSGCSDLHSAIASKDTSQMQHMTPAEARADFARHLDAIQEVLGGTWINRDNPVAEGCGLKSDSGFYYEGGRVRTEAIIDHDAAGEAAAAYWKARGFEVRSMAYRPTHRLVTATSPNGTTIYLKLEKARNVINAEGPCNEGNWGDVRRQDARRVDAEERHSLPQTDAPTGVPTEAPSDARTRESEG